MVLDCEYHFLSSCSSMKKVDEETGKYYGRKAVSFVLITITGGVALSALDDLAIYHRQQQHYLEMEISIP